MLSQAAAQPVLAKLGDVFGRKSVLLICYVFFAVGNLLTCVWFPVHIDIVQHGNPNLGE